MMVSLKDRPASRDILVLCSRQVAVVVTITAISVVIVGGVLTIAHLMLESFALSLGVLLIVFVLAIALWMPDVLPRESELSD